MIRRTLAVLVPLVLLVACSSSPAGSTQESQGGGQSSAPSSGGSAAESSAPSSAATQQPGGGNGLASVDLTITGGDYAGHYQVDLVGSGGCSTGVVGPGTFAVASIDYEPADAFVGPQITIYDADAAASGTDVEFSAAFPFDNYAYTVEVNPYLSRSQGSDFGSGTATLDNRGSTATVTIEATTQEGIEMSATIECDSVTTL